MFDTVRGPVLKTGKWRLNCLLDSITSNSSLTGGDVHWPRHPLVVVTKY